MLSGQIVSCSPPVCDNSTNPDIDVPYLEGVTEIVRTYKIATSGYQGDLLFIVQRHIAGPPRCATTRTYEVASTLDLGIGVDNMYIVDSAGTTFWEYHWNYDSNAVNTAGTGIYKRTGTNTVLANGIGCKYRKYTFKASTYSYSRMDGDYSEQVLYKTTQLTNCSTITGCDPGTVDIYGTKYKQVVSGSGSATWTTGSLGLPGTITFNYLPVSSADVAGLVVTIVSGGPWKIKVAGGGLTISSASGTTYSFSGTLISAASAISATSGGSLFTATVGSLVYGSVALVSDLKTFETEYLTRASCSTNVPLIFAGEDLAPSSISQSHFVDTSSSGGTPFAFQVPFDSAALALGYEDTKAGYLDWLKKPKYPKYPVGYGSPGTITPYSDSYNLFNQLEGYFFNGGSSGLIKYWSDSPGTSTATWVYDTADYWNPPYPLTEQTTEYVDSSYCSSSSFCARYDLLCGGGSFTCPIGSYPYVCISGNTVEIPVAIKSWGGSVDLTGLWVIR
jgi:hypothetical protein